MADLERSILFYCDVLGADLLMADTPEGEDLRRFPGRAAILSLGGQVFDLCEHASNAGERFDPGDLGTMFDFVDPDGIQIEFAHYNVG